MIRTTHILPLAGSLALLLSIPALGADPSPASGSFITTGSLIQARGSHTATLLPDGRVLVVGGNADSSSPSGYLDSAEQWDPRTATFTAAGTLPVARAQHTATLLPDGRVLIVGGLGSRVAGANVLGDAELWDPATDTFEPAGSLAEPRWFHSATLLSDGSVLVVGGMGREHLLADAEIWDPVSRSFHATGPLLEARSLHTATLLNDGRVLIAGGYDPMWGTPVEGSTEIWDPATGSFLPTGPLAEQRSDHTATLLPDGRVLVVGGEPLPPPLRMLDSVEAWDPATESSSQDGVLLEGRAGHTATLLPDGGLLVIGGVRDDGGDRTPMATAELRDPDTETFQLTGSMALARRAHTATLLPDGRVIVIGGYGGPGQMGDALASAEVWTP